MLSLLIRSAAAVFVLVSGMTVATAPVDAQAPPQAPAPARPRLPDMQVIADSLGVTCDYCHGRGQTAVTATGKPRLAVARDMIEMTNELNARVQAATEKAPAESVRVDCLTCHRGVAIPRQLRDIMLQATVQQGPEKAAELYRDLRTRYYGGQAYDFSEMSLLVVSDRLSQTRPEDAIAIAELNIEFFPDSWRSHLAKGIAQTRRMALTPNAVESFKKVLEMNPGNGVAQGWLLQTEPVARRQQQLREQREQQPQQP